MKIIEKLSDMIEEELNDAEKYIRCALENKESYPAVAEVFATLSGEEIKHMQMLHNQVAALIEEHKKKNGNPPEKMMALYEYLHKKHISHTADIKVMQSAYKDL